MVNLTEAADGFHLTCFFFFVAAEIFDRNFIAEFFYGFL